MKLVTRGRNSKHLEIIADVTSESCIGGGKQEARREKREGGRSNLIWPPYFLPLFSPLSVSTPTSLQQTLSKSREAWWRTLLRLDSVQNSGMLLQHFELEAFISAVCWSFVPAIVTICFHCFTSWLQEHVNYWLETACLPRIEATLLSQLQKLIRQQHGLIKADWGASNVALCGWPSCLRNKPSFTQLSKSGELA